MKVIGAGLPRTGTLSTRAALEQIVGPCYHGATPMVEKPGHRQFWVDALDQEMLDKEEARDILADYQAGVDLPFSGWLVFIQVFFLNFKELPDCSLNIFHIRLGMFEI